MKKIILRVVACLSIIMLTACGNNLSVKNTSSMYNSYVVDATNDGMVKDIEKTWWTSSDIEDSSVKEEGSVKWNGTEYTGKHIYSRYGKNGHMKIDYYYNGDEVTFSLYEDGTFEGIELFGLKKDYYYKDEVENPYENACTMATEIASQYINIELYQLEEDIDEPNHSQAEGEKLTLYNFKYIKYVDGFPTPDTFYVQITSKGDLRVMHIGHIGCFEGVDVSNIDLDEVEKSIDNKLQDVYSYTQSYTYDIEKQTIAYTPENELAIISQMGVTVNLKNGNQYVTGVVLATILDEEMESDYFD